MRKITLIKKSGDVEIRKIWGIAEFLDRSDILPDLSNFFVIRQKHKGKPRAEFFNDPITFDIETSTTMINENQYTWMYHWQVCFCGIVITGRTWDEFTELLLFFKKTLSLSDSRRIIIYVHNFPYEFAFLIGRYPFKHIFARQPNKPLTASLGEEFSGIEFRCTYSISGKSLESLSKDIPAINYIKDKNDIDHTIIRTSKTHLTDLELSYCAKDVLIPYQYIKYLTSSEKSNMMYSIPITKTGFVRREARDYFGRDPEYQKFFHKLELDGLQFILYNQAFRGGDTHANAWCCGEIFDSVDSYDISSSYPYRILCEEFPCSKPHTIINPGIEEFNELWQDGYLFIVQFNIENVKLKTLHAPYIPIANCNHITNYKNDNGRVITADFCQITVTNIDLQMMVENYDFNIVGINYIVFHNEKSILPQKMREFVIDLYQTKTTLKGVESKEEQYRLSKENLNSVYGMCVTNPLNDEITFDTSTKQWCVNVLTLTDNNIDKITEELKKYYNRKDSFLPYEIGVFITAYARRDLHRAISGIGTDALYWDTDSVKFIGDHSSIFDKLNHDKLSELKKRGYNINEYSPKDLNGNRHPIGYWEKEYQNRYQFRTLGAKKYFMKTDHGESITVAGLRKKAADYITKQFGSVLNIQFGDIIPAEYSGRSAAEYVYTPFTIVINGEEISENSYVNLTPVDYTFGDTDEHKMYVLICKKKYSEKER